MDDDELREIREKKARELEEKMHARARPAEQARVITIDAARFTEILDKNPFLVIDFWAEWCGPCKMVAPVIEQLAAEYVGRITFGKCNTDHNQQLAQHFSISAIPTILLFSHGKMIDRVVGAYPAEALRSRIIRAFGAK